jgi:ABC-2 type transport system ATP-binding protein
MNAQTLPPAAEPAWIIETHALTKRFQHVTAVDGLTLAVSEGEVFGLLGPNGAGKSTVMKMLVTLLPPTSGTATVAGYDLLAQPALVRRSIGYVPQLLSADGMLTGYENLLLFAQLYDLPRKERAARIDQALSRVRHPRTGKDVVTSESVRDIATTTTGKVRLTLLLAPGDDPALARSVRQAIEQMLGTRVYLDLWVKVRPKWRNVEAELRRLGYSPPPRE